MNYNDDNSKERWVLLGGFVAIYKKKSTKHNKLKLWISEYKNEKESGSIGSCDNIWYCLFKICDGIKFDAYVEESNFDEKLEHFPELIEESSKEIRVKVYLWFNFGLNVLTKYNCKKGVLTLTNQNFSFYVLFHLKSTFNFKYSENNICTSNSLLDLFNRLIIRCELFQDLIKDKNIENILFRSMYNNNCKVLNCIEHLSLKNNIVNKLTIKNVIDYIGKEISYIERTSDESDKNERDLLELLIRNKNDIYRFYGIRKKNINDIPIEIWWKIMDFLDVTTNSILSKTCSTLFYVWLTHFNNRLLPHQRKSVLWLLKRENVFLKKKHKNEDHWLFNNPIKYLTFSDDYLKYMSIWHYLKIKDISQIVESKYLGNIVWDNFQNKVYLMGLKIHPKNMNEGLSDSLFHLETYSEISLYFNHVNRRIHLGYIPNIHEFRKEFFRTRGGIFCDEPGLGKTLSILSLITKTPNKNSIVNDGNNINIEYPSGVYRFLCDINDDNNVVYFLYNMNSKLKLIDKVINDEDKNLLSSKATLIIVPNHLVHHWISEIKKWYRIDVYIVDSKDGINWQNNLIEKNDKCSKNQKKEDFLFPNPIYLFDDPSTDIIPDPKYIINAGIVIISYRMLTKQYQLCKVKHNYKRAFIEPKVNKELHINRTGLFQQEKSPILLIKWLRVIIDEGHNIGNSRISSTLYQQFIFKIKSDYKWIMSGTPLPISLIKSLNTNIPNIFNFFRLPIMLNKSINYEDSKLNNAKIRRFYEPDNNSLFKMSTKIVNNKLNPIGIFTILAQLGTLIVHNYKSQCLKNYLPKLIGPNKQLIKPFINNEFFIYNMLTELTQRNLFCTYYSDENVDSLLHSSNLNYRQELIWNLRFASVLGFTMNLKDYILDDNKLELIKYMNLTIPFISVNLSDIDELYLMLVNKHELYENDHFYNPISDKRIEFVLNYFKNLKLVHNSRIELNDQYESQSENFEYYNCDSCGELLMFPLILPCPKIHLVCVYCIMSKLNHEPIEINLNIGKYNNVNLKKNSEKKKFIWPYRKQVDFCIICGPKIRINPDFFDRLQVPIQIEHIEYKYDDSKSLKKSVPSKINENISLDTIKLYNLPIIIELKNLLINNYKSNEIEDILRKLYQKFNDITISNINNYLLNYIGKDQNKEIFSIDIYKNIPLISIGLIALSSSKLRYILHCILRDIQNNSNTKIMIVSSFWQQLDFIYYTLKFIFNIGTCRYYPHTPKSELLQTISNFKDNPIMFVLLLSVELGSHGLDLSCVDNVYIIDPIIDESVENQTISRAYRIRSNKNLNEADDCIRTSSEYSYLKVNYCLVENTMEDILYDYIVYKRFYERSVENSEFQISENQKSISNIFNNKMNSNDKKRKRTSTSSYCSQGGKTHIRKKRTSEKILINKSTDMNYKIITEDDIYEMDSSQLILRIFIK